MAIKLIPYLDQKATKLEIGGDQPFTLVVIHEKVSDWIEIVEQAEREFGPVIEVAGVELRSLEA